MLDGVSDAVRVIGFAQKLRNTRVYRAIRDRKPKKGQSCVAVAVVSKGKEVLMVKRRSMSEKLSWGFPSGQIKASEPAGNVAQREVLQETNINCYVDREIGKRHHPDTNVFVYYFKCTYKNGEIKNLDTDENSEVKWVKATEAKLLLTTNLDTRVEEFLDEISRTKN